MGLRPIKVDPLQSMGFKIAEYQTGKEMLEENLLVDTLEY